MTNIDTEDVYCEAVDLVLGCENLHAGAVTDAENAVGDFDGVGFFDDYEGVYRSFYVLELLEAFIERVNAR